MAVSASVVTLALGAAEILILVMNGFCLDCSLALEAVWWGKFYFWQLYKKCVVHEEIPEL